MLKNKYFVHGKNDNWAEIFLCEIKSKMLKSKLKDDDLVSEIIIKNKSNKKYRG